jgi:hypothetical protein
MIRKATKILLASSLLSSNSEHIDMIVSGLQRMDYKWDFPRKKKDENLLFQALKTNQWNSSSFSLLVSHMNNSGMRWNVDFLPMGLHRKLRQSFCELISNNTNRFNTTELVDIVHRYAFLVLCGLLCVIQSFCSFFPLFFLYRLGEIGVNWDDFRLFSQERFFGDVQRVVTFLSPSDLSRLIIG